MQNIHCNRMQGRVAVVTGAAVGIGRATAQRLAAEGAAVMIADVSGGALSGVADEINAAGGRAAAMACDVSDEGQVSQLMQQAERQFGGVHILANVAGVSADPKKSVDETKRTDFDRVLAVNLTGTFLCAKHAAIIMKRQHYGRIVNVASIATFQPTGFGNTPYTASKGAVAALARQWVLDLSAHGITVNSVAPGVIRTPRIEPLGEEWARVRGKRIPVGRLGLPEDVAAAIAFLASEEASFVTGHMLVVDGGMTAAVFTAG